MPYVLSSPEVNRLKLLRIFGLGSGRSSGRSRGAVVGDRLVIIRCGSIPPHSLPRTLDGRDPPDHGYENSEHELRITRSGALYRTK